MSQLPSGYTHLEGLYLSSYLDTGVYPSDDLEIEFLFSGMTSGYIFGARNSNSNTSAGQYNLYYGGTSTSYFGYRSARVNLGTFSTGNIVHFYGLNNSMQLNGNTAIITSEGATGTFTGTRTVWLGGLDNAGSLLNQVKYAVHGLSIKQGGTLIRYYIPCYDTANSQVGLYDTVNSSFTSLSTPATPPAYLVTINDNTGGVGYARTMLEDKAKQIYGGAIGLINGYYKVNLIAEAEDGYEFANWTDGNGNVVSTEPNFQYEPTAAITLTPNFRKITKITMDMNYFVKNFNYGQSGYTTVQVRSATIKTDTLQKSSSTIVLDSVPSTMQKNSYVLLYSPRGKMLYIGLINAIEGNTITCREPLAIYDQNYIFTAQSNAKVGLMYWLDFLLARADNPKFSTGGGDDLMTRKMYHTLGAENQHFINKTRFLSLDHSRNPNAVAPSIDSTETKNLEDFLLGIFNDYGVYVDATEYNGRYILYTPFYYKLDDTITIADNSEAITDVNVVFEDQEANVLMIYDSTGATLRGTYGAKTDGTIGEPAYPYSDYVAYKDYKLKLEMTDDNIIDVIDKSLSNAYLNHKITFNVAYGNMYHAEDFYIGRPINFYVGDQMYQSVITSVEFSIIENREQIDGAKITIGKVRTNLTSKLNLGKVK